MAGNSGHWRYMEPTYLSYLIPSLGQYFKCKTVNEDELSSAIVEALNFILQDECKLKLIPLNYMCTKSVEISIKIVDKKESDLIITNEK